MQEMNIKIETYNKKMTSKYVSSIDTPKYSLIIVRDFVTKI